MSEAEENVESTQTKTILDADGDEVLLPKDHPVVENEESTEVTEEEPTDAAPAADETIDVASPDTPAVDEGVDEKTAKEIIELGKWAYQYQKERPGFDFKNLHKEFTQTKMELSEKQRKLSLYEAPEEVTKEAPTEDLSDIAEGDVALIERVLKAKGYVKKDELQETQTQMRKRTESDLIQTFIQKHPEYSDEKDPQGARWNTLVEEFKLFDKTTRENPERTLDLLERAHRIIMPASQAKSETIKHIAEAKRNRLGQQSSEGSGGSAPQPEETQVSSKHAAMLASLKGFSAEEQASILKRLSSK